MINLGIRNNKTYSLKQYKQQKQQNMPRRKEKMNSFQVILYFTDTKTKLLQSDYLIEIPQITKNQYPWWMLIYEETQEIIHQIQDTQIELKKIQDQKILIQFDDKDELDRQIMDLTKKCTDLIKNCEKNVQKLNSNQQNKILQNIQKQLATQIQQIAKNLRSQQKQTYDQINSLNHGNQANFLQLSTQKMLEMKDFDNDLELQQENNHLIDDREYEIQNLMESINQMGQIFKSMGELVVEQGTVLDRIDFNIQESLQETTNASKQLIKADKTIKNSFGQKCVKIQIIFILILLIILIIKYLY